MTKKIILNSFCFLYTWCFDINVYHAHQNALKNGLYATLLTVKYDFFLSVHIRIKQFQKNF